MSNMTQHQIAPGTPEWHTHRSQHFNASDAPAMLGLSPYKTRDQLLAEFVTGEVATVDAGTQRRFDDGHEFERLARPLAEQIIGEELYQIVGSLGMLSASFDGLTLLDDPAWEHKTLNDRLRACMTPDCTGADLPEDYRVQMEQQCMVSGATRVLFMASTWKDGQLAEERHCWYESDPVLAQRIRDGWAQFANDATNYKPAERKVEAVGKPLAELPTLYVDVTGQLVTRDNLKEFRAKVDEMIAGIKTDLQTDQDFADAEMAVKQLDSGEKRIALVLEQSLEKTANLADLFKALRAASEDMRQCRLTLSKKVEAQKKNRRDDIARDAAKQLVAFMSGINNEFVGASIPTPDVNFYDVIKGKRSFDMMVSACNDTIAKSKIAVNEIAGKVRRNLAELAKHAEHDFLFPNKQQLAFMEPDHLALTIKSKIDDYRKQQEQQEAARVQKHKNTIAGIEAAGEFDEATPYAQLVLTRQRIDKIATGGMEEFALQADNAKAATLSKIDARLKAMRDDDDRRQEEQAAAKQKAASTMTADVTMIKPPAAPYAVTPQAKDDAHPLTHDLDEGIAIHAAAPEAKRARPSAEAVAELVAREHSIGIREAFHWLSAMDFKTAAIQWENAA